ncbi:levanbiose-producing levanase [Halobacillus karajensis]|uniref:glycoside hydrolase family 32 protein n=1 Tax=Halobacillus karajensis TaxID=195088 RepID=UPI0008A722EC|nr:glycoside hydrolase family 32 protein [Halobacillus karajensis]SEI10308.1 levanbiose-producing levanase [Halobacillus karajensis]
MDVLKNHLRKLLAASFLFLFIAVVLNMSLWEGSKFKLSTVQNPPPYSYRADYHFTSPDHWKNDPQRPIYLNGKYHYYYLYNKDYPDGNGTEWRHATSKDFVHWKDEGVAIPKYTNENGDVWSGSVVVDHKNTAGFGKNTIVAIITQPSANGQQEQYLWYSLDGGDSFSAYKNEPVLSNPGTEDFRDPKVIWNVHSKKWIMLMAEGSKIGFYESGNLKDWKYTGGFQTEKMGLIECPDLFQMRASDGTIKWVMGVSANGQEQGGPNTYAYWVGHYKGGRFVPEHEKPKWLDYGFDWYGGVTFDDGKTEDKLSHRYALAWMNNWKYANNTPTLEENFNGLDSVVRKIELKKEGQGGYFLASQPNKGIDQFIQSTDSYRNLEVNGMKTLKTKGDVYQLEADIRLMDLKNAGIRVRESKDHSRHIDIGVSLEGGYSYVNRGLTAHPDHNDHMLESQAPIDKNKKTVHLKVLVDKTSVEVFIDDGKVVHSNQVFPPKEDQGITLFSEGGRAVFENVKIKHMDSAHN